MKYSLLVLLLSCLSALGQPIPNIVLEETDQYTYITNVITNIDTYAPIKLSWIAPDTNSHVYVVDYSKDFQWWKSYDEYVWSGSTNVFYTNKVNIHERYGFFRVRYNYWVTVQVTTNK